MIAPRWHRRWRTALGHSLKARLVLMFLALALGTTLIFVAGTRELFSTGWRELARPLVADYLDRLALEIGSPHSVARAQALVRRLLRPLEDIHAGTLRYGSGNFSTPIPQHRRDELGELADHVNAMAASLQRMLEGQRGLLLAISHELRSPLTRARLHAELLAEGSERSALLRDLGQMRDLISDLLESERLAAGAAVLQREPTDLNALVRDLVVAQFADRSAALQLCLADGLPTLALDRARLQLLLRNLLDNALRHGAGTPVDVITAFVDDELRLTVRDHGPGADAAQLQHLGEAFYRPDAARTRSAGGVGLGLYLCRLVAQSHGGRLQLHNAAPGLAVSLWLPVSRPAAGPA